MKKEYAIKDHVWIHNGERDLVKGRVVEVIDLTHLNEGHSKDEELYVIEIETGIDNIYEVRPYDLISPDATGPIQLFRIPESRRANRLFKKMGMDAPVGEEVVALVTPSSVGNVVDIGTSKPRRKYYRKPKK
jgi:hypothetical protein